MKLEEHQNHSLIIHPTVIPTLQEAALMNGSLSENSTMEDSSMEPSSIDNLSLEEKDTAENSLESTCLEVSSQNEISSENSESTLSCSPPLNAIPMDVDSTASDEGGHNEKEDTSAWGTIVVDHEDSKPESDQWESYQKQAEEFKEEGNVYFHKRRYDEAVEFYTKAIDLLIENKPEFETLPKKLAVYYANRSITYCNQEYYEAALDDAEKSLKIDETLKGTYRKAVANFYLGHYEAALYDFRIIIKTGPYACQDVIDFMQTCKTRIRMSQFAAAISTEQLKPSNILSTDHITLEQDYSGPALESINDAIPFFKELCNFLSTPGNKLHKKYAYQLVLYMIDILKELRSLVYITVPDDDTITVCGDIHGQDTDLLTIFNENGYPSETHSYLFNGDFVDRGRNSVECILILFSAKLAYPKHVHLARGNHESSNMNDVYGFADEVKRKYDYALYELCTECFCYLPLAHVINKQIFVVHGGLFSKDGVTLDEIEKLDRFRQPPACGLMTDLLWSDPQPLPGRSPSKRGVACQFGPDVTEAFLKLNKLTKVIRSHEMKWSGYSVDHDGKLITVFSAPNYCSMMNHGAYLSINGKTMEITYNIFPKLDSM